MTRQPTTEAIEAEFEAAERAIWPKGPAHGSGSGPYSGAKWHALERIREKEVALDTMVERNDRNESRVEALREALREAWPRVHYAEPLHRSVEVGFNWQEGCTDAPCPMIRRALAAPDPEAASGLAWLAYVSDGTTWRASTEPVRDAFHAGFDAGMTARQQGPQPPPLDARRLAQAMDGAFALPLLGTNMSMAEHVVAIYARLSGTTEPPPREGTEAYGRLLRDLAELPGGIPARQIVVVHMDRIYAEFEASVRARVLAETPRTADRERARDAVIAAAREVSAIYFGGVAANSAHYILRAALDRLPAADAPEGKDA